MSCVNTIDEQKLAVRLVELSKKIRDYYPWWYDNEGGVFYYSSDYEDEEFIEDVAELHDINDQIVSLMTNRGWPKEICERWAFTLLQNYCSYLFFKREES